MELLINYIKLPACLGSARQFAWWAVSQETSIWSSSAVHGPFFSPIFSQHGALMYLLQIIDKGFQNLISYPSLFSLSFSSFDSDEYELAVSNIIGFILSKFGAFFPTGSGWTLVTIWWDTRSRNSSEYNLGMLSEGLNSNSSH